MAPAQAGSSRRPSTLMGEAARSMANRAGGTGTGGAGWAWAEARSAPADSKPATTRGPARRIDDTTRTSTPRAASRERASVRDDDPDDTIDERGGPRFRTARPLLPARPPPEFLLITLPRAFRILAGVGLLALPLVVLAQVPPQSQAQPAQTPAPPEAKAPPPEPGACPGCGHRRGAGAGMGHGHGPGGMGRMGGGDMGDPQHQADMEVFHYLVDHGKEITRTSRCCRMASRR